MQLGEGAVHWIGLDYQGVLAGLAAAGIEMTPALWEEVRVVEAGAIEALNEVRT